MGRIDEEQDYGILNKLFSKPIVKVLIGPLTIALIGGLFTHIIDSFSLKQAVVQNMSERFAIIEEKMSYESALDKLTEYVADIEKENAEYKSNNTELNNTIDSQEKEIKKLEETVGSYDRISQAEAYAENGEYELAITVLRSIDNKSDEVVALLNEYTGIYEKLIVKDAEALANNGKYDDAISIIDDALKIIPDSQVLKDEKNSVEPKYLNDEVQCYNAENILILEPKESVTITGKKYRHGMYSHDNDFASNFLNNSYSSTISYNLDGKYKQLSGIIGHIDFSGEGTPGQNDAGQVYNARVSIWGDDTELGSYELSPKDRSVPFNVHVDRVDVLEFQIDCGGNSEVGIVELVIR